MKILLILLGLSITSQASFPACMPIPGANQLWSNKQVRWIFVGELHGSNETPAAFADLLCDAAAHGKTVIAALERPASEQNALSGMLTVNDLPSAEKFLLDEPGWKNGTDGRASEAMLRLLLSLRELHLIYPQLSVAAFDTFTGPYRADRPGDRDEAMGRELLTLGRSHPDAIILILTGNLHGMEAPMQGYRLAAMYIPGAQRISLQVTDTATGDSWTDWSDGCGSTRNGVKQKGPTSPRGIYLDPDLAPYGKVDGILSLGLPLSSSGPADGILDPLPECRKKFLIAHPSGEGD
jgi:hypothetical protein